MQRTPVKRTLRIVAVLAAVLAIAGVTACGRNDVRANDAKQSGGDATTTAAPAATTSSTAPSKTGGTTVASSEGYTSAITNEVVDNAELNEFEASTKRLVERAGLPGASLLVMQHGKLIEQEAWSGYDLDTVVPIASASKWMTAATVMTLVDEGKLDLDAPISTYLDFADGEFGTITTRQLLSLTSGIPDDERIPCISDPNISLQDCNRQIADVKLLHEPGAAFRYGGQHLHVAAGVAEAVSGKSFNELFAERITGPLGMTHTHFMGVGMGVGFDPQNLLHPGPAGTGVATLGDYGRYLEMIGHDGVAPSGQRILSHDAIAEMQSNQINDAKYQKAASFRMEQKNPYGLGEWLDWVGPDGKAIVLSSDGAFGFRPWIDKQNDIIGVYMVDDHAIDAAFSEGDPRNEDNTDKIPVSGNWVFSDVAEALGGSLPGDKDQRAGH
jgi:CubicO group peptidase (beta-lactamase class C family)